jgi:Flp pilus assembly protein TadD
LKFDPDFVVGHRRLGEIYVANGMYKDAVSELRRSVELSHGEPTDIAALAHAYAVSGQTTEARDLLHTLQKFAKERYVSSYGMALIYVGLGDKETALGCLEREYERHSTWMAHLKVDPRLDPLRSDPRFADLGRRVGLSN